jgi:Zn-dependent M28 family amino/carboxypeptidase
MKTCRFYSLAVVPGLIVLSACGVRTMAPVTRAAAEPLFANAIAEVSRMQRPTNEGRFEALTAILAERNIAFEVEPFAIEPRKGEPRTTGRNVVVTIPGKAPEIIVGAHYDASRLTDGTLSGGAIDNAASVVILIRLAETLSQARRDARVRVVFFDMEELGLLGSAQFVQAHRERPVLAMVNLDVNASGDTVIFGPRTGTNDSALRSVRAACLTIPANCVEFPRMPPSDDVSFRKGEIPAVSIATVAEIQAHQLWLLMNGGKDAGLQTGFVPQILRTIHTAADTPSLVERDAMVRAYRIALALIATLDRNGRP